MSKMPDSGELPRSVLESDDVVISEGLETVQTTDRNEKRLPNLQAEEAVLPRSTAPLNDEVHRIRAHSFVKERIKVQPAGRPEHEGGVSKRKPGTGEAVLLGALATGVNGPTWFATRAVLVALAGSLVLLLHVAIRSASLMLLVNVLFLITIAGGLAVLLSWYISQIGLVSVEKQMAELNLTDEAPGTESKSS